MGCLKREDEKKTAMLFTTMCIIGLPVEVHIKDGSVYNGIFHTACLENDYGIILKKARMTKKGKSDTNIAIGSLIETLVVLSEDLVQVIAKGVLLPSVDTTADVIGSDVEAVDDTVSSLECPKNEAKRSKSAKLIIDKKENDKLRQVGDYRTFSKQDEHKEKLELLEEAADDHSSRSSSGGHITQVKPPQEIHAKKAPKLLTSGVPTDSPPHSLLKEDSQCCKNPVSENTSLSDTISSGSSVSLASSVNVSPNSGISPAETPTPMAPQQSAVSRGNTKEFKLNPGAKVFSPSYANPRLASPPAVSTAASMTHVPNTYPVMQVAAAQPEIGISPLPPRPSIPVKVVPYSNLTAGIGNSDFQFSQPIVGHGGGRTESVRYAGPYPPAQIHAGAPYMHPNSQAVMVGRFGQLFYVRPVSHDVIPAANISPVPARPILNAHQLQYPKHQGTAAQALQVYVPQPFVAGVQQPFAIPNQVAAVLQPPYPVNHTLSVPGPNGLFTTKFP